MNHPLVSIVLPTYNGRPEWMQLSIKSVLNQTFRNFELIIINDASTNNIEQHILTFLNSDVRIRYYKNIENLGLTATLNKGLSYAKGEYIARIDDDDVWCDQDKLLKQVEFMHNNPDCGLLWTGVIYIDEDDNEICRILNRSTDEDIRNSLLQSNQFVHSSVIMRYSILNKIWSYRDLRITKYSEDYDLWLRIWQHAKFHNFPYFSTKYRVRSWSISGRKGFMQQVNAFRIFFANAKFYPNKLKGFIAHIITTFFPKSIVNYLVALNKRL